VRDVGRDKKTKEQGLPDDLLAPLAQHTGEAAVMVVAAAVVPAIATGKGFTVIVERHGQLEPGGGCAVSA
jgi:hypothetical protein